MKIELYSDAVQEERLCLDCGVDISHRSYNAQRCESCSTERDRILARQRANSYYQENRQKVLQHSKSRQQTPEYKQSRQEWRERNPERLLVYRQRKRQKHREKTGYSPEGRTCETCNADISHRGHRAKWCERCSTPPNRNCLVCGIDISNRGSRAVYCGQQCKRHYHQARESRGYTKKCTKCNKEKEHTEFGLHYDLRRSVCKICEVQSQSERYYNFTSEQRSRRRHQRREREKIKRASRSPAERAMLKAKAREALIRKRFGDFDEYAEYLKQDGKCAICGRAKPFKKDANASECLELDHDHATRKPRGLLCKNCNLKLLSCYEERFPPEHQDSPYLNAYLSRGKQQ